MIRSNSWKRIQGTNIGEKPSIGNKSMIKSNLDKLITSTLVGPGKGGPPEIHIMKAFIIIEFQ